MSAFDTSDMASALPPHLRPKRTAAPAANKPQVNTARNALSPLAAPFPQNTTGSTLAGSENNAGSADLPPHMRPRASRETPSNKGFDKLPDKQELTEEKLDSLEKSPDFKATTTSEEGQDGKVRDARAAGWGEKSAFDYQMYNKSTKELAEEANADGGTAGRGWASNAAIYEWNDEYGDIGPEFPELEKELFGSEHHVSYGIDFAKITQIDVVQEGTIMIEPVRKFEDAGLHPCMLSNVQLAGYQDATPVQAYCLPAILKGYDVVACAQTGSGKTAAYLVPTLSKLMGKAKKLAAPRPNPVTFISGITPPVRAEPLLLVVAPTRELATQIFDEARRFCYRSMLRPCVIYGGGPMRDQEAQLAKGCDVLVATPGRLCAFIDKPRNLSLRRLKYLIVDEADEMLQDDWIEELNKIMHGGDQEVGNITYMMFSATFPKEARDLAKQHLAHDHVRIRVGRAGSTHVNIKQQIVAVRPEEKKRALIDLLISMPPARTIIFVNSKHAVDEVDDFLFNEGDLPCTSVHSGRTQLEREDALRSFRTGKNPILVASNVGSRGLDVKNVMHVVNYELPSAVHGGIEEYTHRIGRTGRIGNTGLATSFYTGRDEDLAPALTLTLLETNQDIPECLQLYVPEGYVAGKTKLKFEADSDFGDDDEAGAIENNGGGWGTLDDGADADPEKSTDADGVWGTPAIEVSEAGDDGWGAPARSHSATRSVTRTDVSNNKQLVDW